ncbi:MAG TPA: hypothetical protein VHP83_09410, partial [Aggregatilineaceae bacterium]|nr:hypothetical protein [Aggregatilineaceae bacterium]
MRKIKKKWPVSILVILFMSVAYIVVPEAAGQVQTISVTPTPSRNAAGLEAISTSNVDRITQIARLGYGTIKDLEWSPDGLTLAAATGVGILVYDATDLSAPPQFMECGSILIMSMAWGPDSDRLAVGGWDGNIYLWQIGASEPYTVLNGHGNAIFSLEWQYNKNLLASGSTDGTIQLWDVRSGIAQMILDA